MTSEMEERTTTRSTFLVEHYWPGIEVGAFEAAAERVRENADELSAAGRNIRFLHSTLVLEDEAAFCVFEADSRASIEAAYDRSGVAYDRIVDAVQITSGEANERDRLGSKRAGHGREEP